MRCSGTKKSGGGYSLSKLHVLAVMAISVIVMMLVMLVPHHSAFATDSFEISSSDLYEGSETGIGWNSVRTTVTYDKKVVGEIDGKTGDGNKTKEYYVKHAKKDFTRDVNFKIVKEKARNLDGRWADVTITIPSVEFTYKKNVYQNDTYLKFCNQTKERLWIGTRSTKQYGLKDTGVTWKCDVTVNWTWNDTGKTVDSHFLQVVYDLDQKNEKEAWRGLDSGYSRYTLYKGNKLENGTIKGKTNTDYWVPQEDKSYPREDSKGNVIGDESEEITKVGLYASTKTGKYTSRFYGGNSSAKMSVCTEIPNVLPPTKTVQKPSQKYKVGDEIVFEITRQAPTWIKTTLSPYKKIVFEDDLPSGVGFVDAWMLDDGKAAVNKGDWVKPAKGKSGKVRWTFNSSYLGNKANYRGQNLTLRIKCKVLGSAGSSIKNTAGVNYGYSTMDPSTTVPIYSQVNYYVDGEDSPCFSEWVKGGTTYKLNTTANSKATKSDCAGLDGWYTDKACTKKYSAKQVNGTLNLYAKNWVNVTYKVTDTSYQKRHANKTYYLDKARTTKYTSDSQILPANEVKKHHYGDTITFGEGKNLYYKRHSKVRTLKPNGVYTTSDASGERLIDGILLSNTTVYIDWNHASYYDGVYASQ